MIENHQRLRVPDRDLSSARMKVVRAAWASKYYRKFDRKTVLNIAEAVANAGHKRAAEFAYQAVEETGYGIVEHKTIKNQLCTHDLLAYYRDLDLITPRVDVDRKIVELANPAGVIFALAPVTNPVATVYYKTMLAILSRNAIVISPHPFAKKCSLEAALHLASAAEEAGAPSGLIQCVEEPSVELVEDIMSSEKINVIMATGGSAMVRAAYSSGNPALGVGPGNAVAYIDPSAHVDAAARCLVESKSFDNSVLCTNESVCLTLESNRDNVIRALRTAGSHICTSEETKILRDYLWRDGHFNAEAIGKSASWIATQAGIRANSSSRVLVPVVESPGQDDVLFKEKLCPVLTLTAAIDFEQAVTFSSQVSKRGAGHSAAFHGNDTNRLMAFSSSVPVNRVVVNAPCSQGAAGFATNLPPSFMIGTGFSGRSSVGENVGPQHLVNWTKIAYGSEEEPDLKNLNLNEILPSQKFRPPKTSTASTSEIHVNKDDLRAIILEELRNIRGGAE